MNSGPTAERIYKGIRSMILAGEIRPGGRLDPGELSSRLGSSVTPVREALCVLEGEGLVESRISSGFYVRGLDAPALADLYAWMGEVLDMIARSVTRGTGLFSAEVPPAAGSGGPGDRMASLGETLASASPNEEHRRAVVALNARLRPARMAEPFTLTGTDEEIEELEAALRAEDMARLRSLFRRYHQRRRKVASEILRALLRGVAQ